MCRHGNFYSRLVTLQKKDMVKIISRKRESSETNLYYYTIGSDLVSGAMYQILKYVFLVFVETKKTWLVTLRLVTLQFVRPN